MRSGCTESTVSEIPSLLSSSSRVSSEGRTVTARQRPIIFFKRSAGGVSWLYFWIWSIHTQRGRPRGHFRSRLGGQPSVRLTGHRSTVCTGVSSCSLAITIVPYELHELYDWGKVLELYGWWWWWWLSTCIAHYAERLYTALRVPVHCEKECLQCWSKRSDAERWIRQQVPDHRACHRKYPTSEPTATITWYDQLMVSADRIRWWLAMSDVMEPYNVMGLYVCKVPSNQNELFRLYWMHKPTIPLLQ